MDIEEFREVLFWPFIFEDNEDSCFASIVEGGNWRKEESPFSRNYCNKKRPQRTCFAEFMYFQPYVQRFFYGSNEKQFNNCPTSIWTRDDLVKVSLTLSQFEDQINIEKPEEIKCTIEQIFLIRFRLGEDHSVAMIALEIKPENRISLSSCQNLLDQFRRVYPPHWDGEGGVKRIPTAVTWHGINDSDSKTFTIAHEDFYYQKLKNEKYPPVAEHWSWLLAGEKSTSILKNLRQIEDERMSTMTYIAVKNPKNLTRGDFIRLCFADAAGRSDTLPYSSKFLGTFETNYCYDRYWSNNDNEFDMDTRFMNCGYAFTLIGRHEPRFFSNGESGALSHFRNHYFVMGLITHFQKAALLSFFEKLSRAVNENNDIELEKKAKSTLRQIIDFTDRYWFLDLSTQTQAQELYSKWRKHLKLEELYKQVTEEANQLSSYLDNEANKHQDKMVSILTWIGVCWAIFSLCATFGLTEIVNSYNVSPWIQLVASSSLGFIAIIVVITIIGKVKKN